MTRLQVFRPEVPHVDVVGVIAVVFNASAAGLVLGTAECQESPTYLPSSLIERGRPITVAASPFLAVAFPELVTAICSGSTCLAIPDVG